MFSVTMELREPIDDKYGTASSTSESVEADIRTVVALDGQFEIVALKVEHGEAIHSI